MHTILILNPTSGSSDLANHSTTSADPQEVILSALLTHHIQPEIWYTTVEDPGTEMARCAAAAGAELVIAAGGDGTLHAVANGLIGTNSALGILPMGTMNNIARSLAIPEDLVQACEIIACGQTEKIDIGKMNGQIFLEVTGIGLEAALFPAAEEIKSKGVLSTVRGAFNGLLSLLRFQPTHFTVTFDGKRTRHFRAIEISVCNSPYYGARLQFAPEAKMNDGLLDVLIYRNFSKFQYMRHALSISQGKRVLEPNITQRKIKSIHIETEQPVDIHVDGVPNGQTPATIEIQVGALQVRVPEHIASKNMLKSARKKTRRYQKIQSHDLKLEKGPLHV